MKRKVVAALVVRDGNVLVGKRPKDKPRGGLWEFVGGKVEKDESAEDALDRECREEIGVGAKAKGLFMSVVHEYPDLTVELSLYRAELLGKPRALEHDELKWVSPSDFDKYEFCPADTVILEKLKEEL